MKLVDMKVYWKVECLAVRLVLSSAVSKDVYLVAQMADNLVGWRVVLMVDCSVLK